MAVMDLKDNLLSKQSIDEKLIQCLEETRMKLDHVDASCWRCAQSTAVRRVSWLN